MSNNKQINVESVARLVNAAKDIIRDINKDETVSAADGVDRLFPTLGAPRAASQSGLSNAAQSISSLWNTGGKNKKRKVPCQAVMSKRAKAPKISQCLKDVFLIPSPNITNVPRKSNRQLYYNNSLVLSAVSFSSDMSETDIRCKIMARFDELVPEGFQFEFIKPIGDEFVVPSVDQWDYKTVKHLSAQGPIYIRSLNNLEKAYLHEHELDAGSVEDCNQKSQTKQSDIRAYIEPERPINTAEVSGNQLFSSTSNLHSDQAPGCSKTITSPRLMCPICFNLFPLDGLKGESVIYRISEAPHTMELITII